MTTISLKDLGEQLNWYSSSVSSAVRATAFGVIAAIWAIFTADGISLESSGLLGVPTQSSVRSAFILAAGALFTDILQYVAAYWMTSIGYDKFEAVFSQNEQATFSYDRENLGRFGVFLYGCSFLLFRCKLVLAILSAVAFLFLAFGISVGG